MSIARIQTGRWRVIVRLRSNGEIVHRQATVTGDREDARAAYEKIRADVRESCGVGCSLKPVQASTFEELLNIYRDRSGKVAKQDVSRYNRLINDLGGVRLLDFAPRFESYMKLLRVTPTAKTGKPPSPGTYNRTLATVRAAFSLAVKLEITKTNPITPARFPKMQERPRDRYLTDDERLRLFNAIERHAPYLGPIIRYSLRVPCRKGELVNLPRDAYNAITNTIYVPDSKAGVPIYKPVPDEMKHYFRNIPPDCPYLFYRPARDGGYLPLGDFKKSWRSCLKIAGVQNCRVHDLRHVAATDLTIAGNSEREIMDVAGWRTPMLSTYWHKDSLRSAQSIRFSGGCDSAVIVSKAANG